MSKDGMSEALLKKLKHASLSGANAAAFKAIAAATLSPGSGRPPPISEEGPSEVSMMDKDPLFLSDPVAAKLRVSASTVNLGHLQSSRKRPDRPGLGGLVVLCRICEEQVLAASLEDHTTFCAIANNADYTTASCDEKLDMLKAALQFRTQYMDEVREESGEGDSNMSSVELTLRKAMYRVITILESIIGVLPFDFEAQVELEQLKAELENTVREGTPEHTVLKEVLRTANSYLQIKLDAVRNGQKAKTGARQSAVRGGYADNVEELQALTEKKKRVESAGSSRLAPTRPGSSKPASSRPFSAKVTAFTLADFEILKPISRGAYGQVILARKKTTSDLYAIKIIPKSKKEERRKQVKQVMVERNILKESMSTFIVKYYSSFQTSKNLYMVMEYVPGGDLLALLLRKEELPEAWAKLYIAELVLALEWLHSQGIIHRDLKPDNILLTGNGHIRLTDFGLSESGLTEKTKGISDHADKRLKMGLSMSGRGRTVSFNDKSSSAKRRDLLEQQNTPVGTPDYIAPEALLGQEHGPELDWWGTGIILFELLSGIPPFNDDAPELIFQNILSMDMWWPDEISEECRDLITKLLTFDPKFRLGHNGAAEVKAHPFFADIDWDAVGQGRIAMPWVPENALADTDVSLFDRGRSNFQIAIESSEQVLPSATSTDLNLSVDASADPSRTPQVQRRPNDIMDPVQVKVTPSIRRFDDVSIDALAYKNQTLADEVTGKHVDRNKLKADLLRGAEKGVAFKVGFIDEDKGKDTVDAGSGGSPALIAKAQAFQSAPNLLNVKLLSQRHSSTFLQAHEEGAPDASVLSTLDEDALKMFFRQGTSLSLTEGSDPLEKAHIASDTGSEPWREPTPGEAIQQGFFERLNAKASSTSLHSNPDPRRTSEPIGLTLQSIARPASDSGHHVRPTISSAGALGIEQDLALDISADDVEDSTDPHLDPDYVRIE